MAGHSQFKNIMHRKGAQDKRKAKIFTKLARELAVAAKEGGADPEFNARLRAAISDARSFNMPKDKIENAIKKALSADFNSNYSEMQYEGYGPHGVAIIVEAMTDNKNRTASEVRSLFTKSGGTLGETGSVSYMFNLRGIIYYSNSVAPHDPFLTAVLELEVEDCKIEGDMYEVYCDHSVVHSIAEKLRQKYGDPKKVEIVWIPHNVVTITDIGDAKQVMKMIDALEDLDDVQSVFCNLEISDDVAVVMENE